MSDIKVGQVVTFNQSYGDYAKGDKVRVTDTQLSATTPPRLKVYWSKESWCFAERFEVPAPKEEVCTGAYSFKVKHSNMVMLQEIAVSRDKPIAVIRSQKATGGAFILVHQSLVQKAEILELEQSLFEKFDDAEHEGSKVRGFHNSQLTEVLTRLKAVLTHPWNPDTRDVITVKLLGAC